MPHRFVPRIRAAAFAFTILAAILAGERPALAAEFAVTPVAESGVYQKGQIVGWDVALTGDGADAISEARYVIRQDGAVTLEEGTVELTDGRGRITTTLDEPGTLWAQVTATVPGESKPLQALGGAAIAPDEIQLALPRPDDFDAFWEGQIQAMASLPMNPQVEAADSGQAGVDYYKVTLDHINGSKIHGQLARPSAEGKYPALLIVQWAGVYGLPPSYAVDPARGGWLTFNIMAHDLPFDQPAEFYAEARNTTLHNYTGIGAASRETSYFLRMFLSCYRAAEYLTQRDDWDGQILVVSGSSQGGLQAIVTAALHPKVTGLMANVPAGCETLAKDANRAEGWPNWRSKAKGDANVLETSRYFDAANFAPRVTVPALVGVGLEDKTCPPTSVIATFNALRGPKELLIMPRSGHSNNHGAYYGRANTWRSHFRKGDPLPPR